ncbi:MAG: PilX N-terminal domain-containing pilus assembly protein [Sedimenticola sp.]
MSRQIQRGHLLNTGYQGGAVLVACMVMLLVMTLIGITALNTTRQEQQMAGNFQSQNRAFEAAESGAKAASLGIRNIDSYDPEPQSKTGDDYIGVYDVARTHLGNFDPGATTDDAADGTYIKHATFEVESTGEVQNSSSDVLSSTRIHKGFYLRVQEQ